MATRFEAVLHGEDEVALRAAAEEALEEIERLDALLSLYRPDSEIARINARAAIEPVRVEPTLFRLLQAAQRLSDESEGAFDITIAPLMRCWGFTRDSGRVPDASEVAEARARVGMRLVHLDERDFTVRFARDGVMLDLGSIGKGFALERAAELLREAGVLSGILHGGTSTICALGTPPDADAWKVAVPHPDGESRPMVSSADPEGTDADKALLAVVPLKDEAMSVSAIWGKSFEAEGRIYGHVIDPRKGEPVEGSVLAAVILPSATETDALSTALLTLGPAGHDRVARLRPAMRSLLLCHDDQPGRYRVVGHGITALT